MPQDLGFCKLFVLLRPVQLRRKLVVVQSIPGGNVKTIDYLDALKVRHGLVSDYALAKALSTTTSATIALAVAA